MKDQGCLLSAKMMFGLQHQAIYLVTKGFLVVELQVHLNSLLYTTFDCHQ